MMNKKGMTEGTIGTLIGIIIAVTVIYLLWRIYGGGGTAPKTTAQIIAGILGR
jgi:hypothetical protein